MKIDKIFVACSKKDFYFTKICIASIRYWCGYSIPIELIIDNSWGDVKPERINKKWNVSIYRPEQKLFLGPYGKIEVLFDNQANRVLILDSDIVFLGNLIEELEKYDEDFVAHSFCKYINDKEINEWWFELNELNKLDSSFFYPGFVFNSGHFVTSKHVFTQSDFDKYYTKTNGRVSLNRPDIFKCEDQGILNHVVLKQINENIIRFKHLNFMISRYDHEALADICLTDILNCKNQNKLIHYLGPKNGFINFLPCSDILRFFEAYYYENNLEKKIKLQIERLFRTLTNPIVFLKETMKWMIK